MLIFPLKKEWYEKIKSGEKTIEYREVKYYWYNRLKKESNRIIYDPFDFIFKIGESEEYHNNYELNCYFQLGYKPETKLKARISKIEVVNGKKTDLKIDKPVYAIHFKLERENLENDRTEMW